MSALQGYTGGYPYLRIARHYGLDYGEVLNWPIDPICVKLYSTFDLITFQADIFRARRHFELLKQNKIFVDTPFDAIGVG